MAGYHPQGAVQTADRNTFTVFLRKRPICLSKIFGLWNRLLVWYSYSWLWRGSREADGCNLCTLPHSGSPVSSRKEFMPFSGAPNCVATAKGHLYITCKQVQIIKKKNRTTNPKIIIVQKIKFIEDKKKQCPRNTSRACFCSKGGKFFLHVSYIWSLQRRNGGIMKVMERSGK